MRSGLPGTATFKTYGYPRTSSDSIGVKGDSNGIESGQVKAEISAATPCRSNLTARLDARVVALRAGLGGLVLGNPVHASLRRYAGVVANERHLLLGHDLLAFCAEANEDAVQVADVRERNPINLDSVYVELERLRVTLAKLLPIG